MAREITETLKGRRELGCSEAVPVTTEGWRESVGAARPHNLGSLVICGFLSHAVVSHSVRLNSTGKYLKGGCPYHPLPPRKSQSDIEVFEDQS